jgi:predicted phosphate transport protein (TIGR00153 family)
MFNLLPKDTVFYDLFEKIAAHAVSCAGHLHRIALSFPTVEPHFSRIRQEEHEADDLAHQALDRLDRTFITPFDREDIHTLVGGLDDIVDGIDALAKRITLFGVKEIEPTFKKQTELLVQSTTAVSDAVKMLRKSRKLSELSPKLIEIHHLESVGDDNNHAAIKELYADGTDPLKVLRWKELYDLIEEALDGCEDVGNTLERIILKNG